ncbi:unnamed protein product [Jaminaea pallidilutea]
MAGHRYFTFLGISTAEREDAVGRSARRSEYGRKKLRSTRRRSSDWGEEARHVDVIGIERHGEAFNAEPDVQKLTDQLVTSQDELYRRNHDDIVYQPGASTAGRVAEQEWQLDLTVDHDIADELGWNQWKRALGATAGSSESHDHAAVVAASHTKSWTLKQLQQDYPQKSVVAAMECAGNRRSDMSSREGVRKAEGIQWNQGTIGNALWQGASLRDFLLSQSIPDPYGDHASTSNTLAPTEKSFATESALWSRNTHIHFLSSQPCSESSSPAGQVFGSSLPLCIAMHPNQDVLLCWSASRQRLGSSHGYPLRVVIPGHVAARWVKWLRGLRISRDENDSPPMKDDYKILRPPVNATEEERRQWVQKMMGEEKDARAREEELHKAKPLMRLGVGSGLSTPLQGQRISEVGGTEGQATLEAAGYAVGTEGSPVSLVELLLLPDDQENPDASDSEHSTESLRQAANAVDATQWHRVELDESNTQKVLPALKGSDDRNPAHGDGEDKDDQGLLTTTANRNGFTWSWTLWKAQVPLPAPERRSESERWALVVRCTTSQGVQQELQSPWNVRGFRERSWPVVRGLTFS